MFGTRLVTLPKKDVLQVATGRILRRTNGMAGVYKVCDQMTGRSNMTHELIETGRQCQEALIKKYPVLRTIIANSEIFFSKKRRPYAIKQWTKQQARLIGTKGLSTIGVPKIKPDEHEIAQKTVELFKGKKIIAVVKGE